MQLVRASETVSPKPEDTNENENEKYAHENEKYVHENENEKYVHENEKTFFALDSSSMSNSYDKDDNSFHKEESFNKDESVTSHLSLDTDIYPGSGPSGSDHTGLVHPCLDTNIYPGSDPSISGGTGSIHPGLVQLITDSDQQLDLDFHTGLNQHSGSGHTSSDQPGSGRTGSGHKGSGRSSGSHSGSELYPGFPPGLSGPDMSAKKDMVDRNHCLGKVKIKNIFDISPIRPVEGETCEIV
jgi:hypothetical protein